MAKSYQSEYIERKKLERQDTVENKILKILLWEVLLRVVACDMAITVVKLDFMGKGKLWL